MSYGGSGRPETGSAGPDGDVRRRRRHLAGLAGVADPVQSTTPEAIRLLRASGIRIVMLTGDNLGIMASPVIASAAMALSSVSVIANALRLRSAKL